MNEKLKNSIISRLLIVIMVMVSLTLPVGSVSARQNTRLDRLIADLEPEIKRALKEGNIPSATIALVSGDRIIWTGAYGYSNVWAHTAATPDTVYLIGSTFKTMSTVALLQLMEQGKFKLDDKVSNYLTEFKIQHEDPTKPVTFRHLLTHTSGMPGDFGPFPLWGDEAPPSLQDYLKKSLKVTEVPMEKEVYSNMAFTLVGYLVQKLSGVEFKKYINDHIFKAVEMDSTDFFPRPDMLERMALPYVFDPEKGQVVTTQLRAAVWPAGLVYGTVQNQANWLIANLNGGVFKGKRLISQQTFEQMMTLQYDKFKGPVENIWGNETAGFGLTWWTQVRNGDHYFAHSGSVPGYTAFLLGNRDKKLGFAILTNGNRAHPHLFKLADKAIDLLIAYMKTTQSG